jgi:hypothetical protein
MEEGYVSIILGIPPFPFLFVMAFGWGMLALALLMHLRYFLSKAVRGPRK